MGSPLKPSPEEKLAAARTRLGELAEKFIQRTRGELEVMRRSLDHLGSADGMALAEILNLAHRINGTGATLGFDGVSERAQRIEQLAAAQVPGSICDAATIETLRTGIEALASELASASARR
jgi:HPt (histidine-containing phosphotransfer) domain-containing protein